ncbi:MAG: putative sulfate/molybdate transporter [Anaerolineae bacterium]
MKIGDFEFSPRELAGSMGDFGTLFPLAIGYIVIVGLEPAGFLVMLGLTNIALGLVYRLPMPLQPKKVVAAVALSQGWRPGLVYGAGLGLGLIWLVLSVTGLVDWLVKITPRCVIRGIQVALGILLGRLSLEMLGQGPFTVAGNWGLGLAAILIILLLKDNRYAPAALVLVVGGTLLPLFRGELAGAIHFGISLPPLVRPAWPDVWTGLVLAGFAQMPLTLTNACLSCGTLIRDYFPARAVPERRLLLNQGIFNTIVPFFGGMPMCHGAGGLVGQYTFGARSGGANIMEGLIEIGLGLFLSRSIVNLFSVFPLAIVGAMLLMVSLNLAWLARDVRGRQAWIALIMTVVVSVATNMALGFLAGLLVYYLWASARGRVVA